MSGRAGSGGDGQPVQACRVERFSGLGRFNRFRRFSQLSRLPCLTRSGHANLVFRLALRAREIRAPGNGPMFFRALGGILFGIPRIWMVPGDLWVIRKGISLSKVRD